MAATKIYHDLFIPGGIVFTGAHQEIGVLFSNTGIMITQKAKENEEQGEPLLETEKTCKILEEVLQPDCNTMSYGGFVSFPILQADLVFPLPYAKNIKKFLSEVPWNELIPFIPEVHLQPSPNMNWTSLNTQRTINRLALVFDWENWKLLSKKTLEDDLVSFLMIIAILKETLREVTLVLCQSAEITPSKDETQKHLLQEALKISPDNVMILELLAEMAIGKEQNEEASQYLTRLGDIFHHANDLDKAVSYYQRAIVLCSTAEKAKLGILISYHKREKAQMAKDVGLELIPYLRKKGASAENLLKKVCEVLLEVDGGMIDCRKELINIYLNRRNYLKAINEYEILADFYQQVGNREQLILCYNRILKLDSSRKDIRQKLNSLKQLSLGSFGEEKRGIREYLLRRKKTILYTIFFVLAVTLFFLVRREWAQWHRISLIYTQIEVGETEDAQKNLNQLSFGFYITSINQEIKYLREKLAQSKKDQKKQMENEKEYEKKRIEFTLKLLEKMIREKKYKQALKFYYDLMQHVQNITLRKKLSKMEKKLLLKYKHSKR